MYTTPMDEVFGQDDTNHPIFNNLHHFVLGIWGQGLSLLHTHLQPFVRPLVGSRELSFMLWGMPTNIQGVVGGEVEYNQP